MVDTEKIADQLVVSDKFPRHAAQRVISTRRASPLVATERVVKTRLPHALRNWPRAVGRIRTWLSSLIAKPLRDPLGSSRPAHGETASTEADPTVVRLIEMWANGVTLEEFNRQLEADRMAEVHRGGVQ